MNSILKFENISKEFKGDLLKKNHLALNNVSFEIPESKIIGFLGANGAGKTTLIKILMKLIAPSKGKVIFSDAMSEKKNIFSNIGYLPEHPFFYQYLTGKELLLYLGQLQGLSKTEILKRSLVLGDKVNISHAFDRPIRKYSKGMLQRVGLIAAVLHEPKLVVLDEPLSGLDPIGRKMVKDLLFDLKKKGQTVFFSSHIVSDLEEVSDYVVVLDKGQLVHQGALSDLLEEENEQFDLLFTSNSSLAYEKDGEYYIAKNQSKKEKDEILKDIYENKGSLIKLAKVQKTLEQVIYK